MIYQVRQINDGLSTEEIAFAYDLAGQFTPDGEGRPPHPRHEISRRASAGGSSINKIVLVSALLMKQGQHARRPCPAHRPALHDQSRGAAGALFYVFNWLR